MDELNVEVNVYSLPREVAEQELAGTAVIVLDILRATTTICHALAAGAVEVVPFRTIEETLEAAAIAGRENVVLGGERRGIRIEGFDLGNSPTEYTPKSVGGRRVFMTTTNGTQALHHARLARRVIVGSYANLSSVAESVKNEQCVSILCAGTDGELTGEDMIAAGAFVAQLRDRSKGRGQWNEEAARLANAWNKLRLCAELKNETLSETVASWMRNDLGGKNCIEVGNEADLAVCARIDNLRIVPELDVVNWRITVR